VMGMVGDSEWQYTYPAVVAATRAALARVTPPPQPSRATLEAALAG
jgi:hypothetical protein